MKCANPYYSRKYNTFFPCGCCLACRAKKAMEWSLRLALEEVYHKDTAFVTLTYAPEHLPAYGSLEPTDMQSFLKRLRRRLNYKIRFYGCGEYGDKFGRAHYHLIIFGLKMEDWHKVHLAWGKGRVECEKPMSQKAFKYVSGYVNKKIGREKEWRLKNPLLKPMFQRCSLGLGLRFVLEKVPFYTDRLIIGDRHRYIGRYLKNKLADKFGIKEILKQKAINMMALETEILLSNFYWSAPQTRISQAEEVRSKFGFEAYMLSVYHFTYGASIQAFEDACRIRQKKYCRGVYNETITPTIERVRRVFA